jgi:hypothetical protein
MRRLLKRNRLEMIGMRKVSRRIKRKMKRNFRANRKSQTINCCPKK